MESYPYWSHQVSCCTTYHDGMVIIAQCVFEFMSDFLELWQQNQDSSFFEARPLITVRPAVSAKKHVTQSDGPPQKKSWIFDRSTLSSLERNVYAKCQWHANKTNTSLSVGGHHDHDVDQWERVNVKTPFTSTTRLLDNWCQLLINLFNDSTTSAWKATTTSVKNEIAK